MPSNLRLLQDDTDGSFDGSGTGVDTACATEVCILGEGDAKLPPGGVGEICFWVEHITIPGAELWVTSSIKQCQTSLTLIQLEDSCQQ